MEPAIHRPLIWINYSGAETWTVSVGGANAEKIPSQDMACPVCGGAVTVTDIGVLCPTCGEYDVSGMVIAAGKLQSLEPRQRREILDRAKRAAKPGKRPIITTYLFD